MFWARGSQIVSLCIIVNVSKLKNLKLIRKILSVRLAQKCHFWSTWKTLFRNFDFEIIIFEDDPSKSDRPRLSPLQNFIFMKNKKKFMINEKSV